MASGYRPETRAIKADYHTDTNRSGERRTKNAKIEKRIVLIDTILMGITERVNNETQAPKGMKTKLLNWLQLLRQEGRKGRRKKAKEEGQGQDQQPQQEENHPPC